MPKVNYSQPNLFGDDQPDLFGEMPPPPAKARLPNPQHVRNRFIDFLAQMEGQAAWPWDEDRVEFYRYNVWPYLYEKLGDAAEAAEWKAKLDAEAARLDDQTHRG